MKSKYIGLCLKDKNECVCVCEGWDCIQKLQMCNVCVCEGLDCIFVSFKCVYLVYKFWPKELEIDLLLYNYDVSLHNIIHLDICNDFPFNEWFCFMKVICFCR